MDNEKPLPLPLSGDEVRATLIHKIEESFSRSCHLKFDNAYTKVTAKIRIELTLEDYGREVKDNHEVQAALDSGLPATTEPRDVTATITLEPMPPNVLRVETGQPVPVMVGDGKKAEIKHVKYTPRKAKP